MAPGSAAKQQFLRDRAIFYLTKFLLTPYGWGESGSGFIDCSGLVVEILQSLGVLQHGTDYTADGLWEKYGPDYMIPERRGYAGCLVFWLAGNQANIFERKAIHVEMMANEFQTIGASGGGRPQMDADEIIEQYPHLARFPKWWLRFLMFREESRRRAAFVKPRPLGYRGDNYVIVDPFLSVK